ncbi:MAG TPA: FtsX-like permease family protein [Pusillimonas sp.]|uniref:ABC transporter permease n=1 Tax=Pusillimonas sp. TaxID=3040095 RepID=UPI002C1BF4FE|nr:FtsX-like permease family protein [Pusillimonas sp.]HUH88040.1 FtsX-like permease family protein [Pusillimonas sp.]
MKKWWNRFLAPSFRALKRDWRSGELGLLALALVIAVTAVSSVGFLSGRVSAALDRSSAQMLGGDLVLTADEPIGQAVLEQAVQSGLEVSRYQTMSSMVDAPGGMRLVSLKAVDGKYPLRGELLLRGEAQDNAVHGGPAPGTAWVDPQLTGLLDVNLGDTITIGESALTISGVISYEPDRGVQFINVAPRVMMRLDELPATGLLGPASRVRDAANVAGEQTAVQAYRQWLEPRLGRGQRLSEPGEARPEIQRSLDRAHQFLTLVALLTVIIAAVAVALAARRFSRRHRDGVAVMRCIGAARAQIASMFAIEFVALALVCATLGVALAFAVQAGLAQLVSSLLDVDLPAPGWGPVWHGYASSLLLLVGFALPPLAALYRVAPMRVLRQMKGQWAPRTAVSYAAGLVAFFLLSWWISGDARMSLLVTGGFVGGLAFFYGIAYGVIRLLGGLAGRWQGASTLRFALKGMTRRPGLATVQVCALAVGLMVMLLLTLARTDLLDGWRGTLPPDAPNTFLINILPEQREAVLAQLNTAGIRSGAPAPMIRGRLLAINDVPVDARTYEDERAQRMVEREFNLSYMPSLPDSNTIVAGRWLDPDAGEVSLETGLADTLAIGMGDTLAFDVAGQIVRVRVTSLREVKWDSFDVNFFALMSPSALENAPATYITSFHLPADKLALSQRLVAEFPNLTVFDVGAILGHVRRIVEQAVLAVQILFLFTVLAGVQVLAAAFAATRDERIHEVAILRVLGAGAARLRRTQWLELTTLGGLSGALAALGSVLLARLLADRVFEFSLGWPWWPWVVGIVGGALISCLGGGLALRGVLKTPPLRMLREVA